MAPAAAADDTPAGTAAPEGQAAAEGAPDNAPALLHLNMTSRQQRRLWPRDGRRHRAGAEPALAGGARLHAPERLRVQGSRGRIAASLGLDVVVDSKARAILIWRDDEKLLPAAAKRLGIGVVKSVGDCLDILTQVDSAEAREQPSVMNRVLRLLGLKEPASA